MMKIKMMTFPFRIKEIIENVRKNINNATNNKQERGLKNITKFLSYTPAEREIIEENYYDLKTI